MSQDLKGEHSSLLGPAGQGEDTNVWGDQQGWHPQPQDQVAAGQGLYGAPPQQMPPPPPGATSTAMPHAALPVLHQAPVGPMGQRAQVGETCSMGHRLTLTNGVTATMIVIQCLMSSGAARNSRNVGRIIASRLVCAKCFFRIQSNENVFVCEQCPATPGTDKAPVLYCERCMASGNYKTPIKAGWSTGLFDCFADTKSCIDTTVCFPCKAAAIHAWTLGTRVEGKPQGQDQCCQACFIYHYFMLFDPITLGTFGALLLWAVQKQAANRLGIRPMPEGCGPFCKAWLCRQCVVCQVHREWQVTRSDLGEPRGCLFNCGGTPVQRAPFMPYTGAITAPLPPTQMGQAFVSAPVVGVAVPAQPQSQPAGQAPLYGAATQQFGTTGQPPQNPWGQP